VARHCRRSLRQFVVGVAVGLVAAAGASAAACVPSVPVFGPAPYHGRGLEVRPSEIDYAVIGYLAGLRWRSWTGREAVGSGSDWIWIAKTGCGPLCSGNYNRFAASVQLDRPRHAHGYWVFTRMRITLTKRRPSGSSRTRTLQVIYAGGAFDWSQSFF
jgi:hypothetical protein